MAIAWSRISSKVIANPPSTDAACRRRGGNWRGCSGAFLPHMVDKKKQEILGARDVAVTPLSQMRGGDVSRVRGHPSPGIDPHEVQEHTMSPHKQDAKQYTKAR